MKEKQPDSVLLGIDLHPIKTEFVGFLAEKIFRRTDHWIIAESLAIDHAQGQPTNSFEVDGLLTDMGATFMVYIHPRSRRANFLLLDIRLQTCRTEYDRCEFIPAVPAIKEGRSSMHDLLATYTTETNHHVIGIIGTN